MSLINDALKRAQEAQRPNTPARVSLLRTVDTQSKDRPFASRLLVVVIFLLVSAAFAFIGLAMTGRLAKKKRRQSANSQVTAGHAGARSRPACSSTGAGGGSRSFGPNPARINTRATCTCSGCRHSGCDTTTAINIAGLAGDAACARHRF